MQHIMQHQIHDFIQIHTIQHAKVCNIGYMFLPSYTAAQDTG